MIMTFWLKSESNYDVENLISIDFNEEKHMQSTLFLPIFTSQEVFSGVFYRFLQIHNVQENPRENHCQVRPSERTKVPNV